jgi:hypothetical protein
MPQCNAAKAPHIPEELHPILSRWMHRPGLLLLVERRVGQMLWRKASFLPLVFVLI